MRAVEIGHVNHRQRGLQVADSGFAGPVLPRIRFRQAEADTSGDVDIVYSLTREWGREGIELEILDIAPSALRRPLEYPR